MNNPMLDVVKEIELFARLGFEFIDLTLEPQAAHADAISVKDVRKSLERTGLHIVGHTAFYLPFASPFASLRECAINEMDKALRVFRDLGATMVNLHPHTLVPLHGADWVSDQNIAAIARVHAIAKRLGITLVVENTPHFSRVLQLRPIFESVPEVGLHLDVGHANLNSPYNRTEELVANFGDRLKHVHVSDNKGDREDLHLPLGVGIINWRWVVSILKNAGYDGPITVEVFAEDDEFLVMSAERIRRLWEEVA